MRSNKRRNPFDLPPAHPESEAALLYMLIYDGPKTQAEIAKAIKLEMFSDPILQLLAKIAVALWERDQAIDGNLMIAELKTAGYPKPFDLLANTHSQSHSTGVAWKPHFKKIETAYFRRTKHVVLMKSLEANQDGESIADFLDQAIAADSESMTTDQPQANLVCLADVTPEPISWLWPGRLALAKINLFSGDPELGKSYVAMYIAAQITRGSPWPDQPGENAPLGSVLILNSEDGAADTIRPRLEKLGADINKAHILPSVKERNRDRSFVLSRDIEVLEQAARLLGDCRLIIIDPITSYLGVDGNRSFEVRGVLDPLVGLAERTGATILLINHMNKGNGQAIHRSMGSMSIPGVARIAHVFAKDKENPLRRMMLPQKNNIAAGIGGLAYCIQDGLINWEREPVTTSADEALAYDSSPGRKPDALLHAMQWLGDYLADGKATLQREIESAAKDDGISKATLKRAREKLGVETWTDGVGKPWQWRLPQNGGSSPSGSESPDIELLEAKPTKCGTSPEWLNMPTI